MQVLRHTETVVNLLTVLTLVLHALVLAEGLKACA